jgi:hypothetical protein
MTCYFRHLREIFQEAKIQVTQQNKPEINRIIQNIVQAEDKTCPQTWREVKRHISQDKNGFVSALKQAWQNR